MSTRVVSSADCFGEVAVAASQPLPARIARASPPSSRSFAEIFERTAPFVWRMLRRFGVRESDLPDVCQEVFVVVYRRLPDFDRGKASLRTWIYGICLRTASQYRRRAPQLREVSDVDLSEDVAMADQEIIFERKRARKWLDRALGQVEEDDRVVFVLYEVEELPMKEVAAVLGCPLQTAYWRLHRARRHVQKAFRAAARERL